MFVQKERNNQVSQPRWAPCENGKNSEPLYYSYHSRVVDVEKCCLERGPRATVDARATRFVAYTTPCRAIPCRTVPYHVVPYHGLPCYSRDGFFLLWHVRLSLCAQFGHSWFRSCVGVRGAAAVLATGATCRLHPDETSHQA
ncbi:unnamed protein product [Laminaria digitata]